MGVSPPLYTREIGTMSNCWGRVLAERIFRGFLFLGRRIFSRIFSPDFFSSFLWEKVPRKILQENPRQNPPKFIQQKSPTHFCRGSGPKIGVLTLKPCTCWGPNGSFSAFGHYKNKEGLSRGMGVKWHIPSTCLDASPKWLSTRILSIQHKASSTNRASECLWPEIQETPQNGQNVHGFQVRTPICHIVPIWRACPYIPPNCPNQLMVTKRWFLDKKGPNRKFQRSFLGGFSSLLTTKHNSP